VASSRRLSCSAQNAIVAGQGVVGGTYVKVLTAAALFAAEVALAMILLVLAPAPSGAQFFFDDRFPSQNYRQRGLFNWFEPAPPQLPPQQHQHQLERAPSTGGLFQGARAENRPQGRKCCDHRLSAN
jgi:hypothetical protein